MRADHEGRSLLVLGLGNPILRDDAAGQIACGCARRKLADETGEATVAFRELCIGGFDLLYEIEGYDDLIVVDAFHSVESRPGRVRLLSGRDLDADDKAPSSAHLLSLPRAIDLSRDLGYRTPKLRAVVVIDVGESAYEFGERLTPEVEQAIPKAADLVCRLVREFNQQIQSSHPAENRRETVA